MIDWDALFSMVNLLALIAWAGLILLPRWPALLSGVMYLGVGLLCPIYAAGLIGLVSGLDSECRRRRGGLYQHRRRAGDLCYPRRGDDRLDPLSGLRSVRGPVDRA